LLREWRRYDLVVSDTSGQFDANTVGNARRERAMFERQLHAIGCSSDAASAAEVVRDD